ncbi:MAG: hypothetical protein K0B15_12315 [Lentimicrobium sp.]|nr:hypothetical protein [Lentimicrobium sp.]
MPNYDDAIFFDTYKNAFSLCSTDQKLTIYNLLTALGACDEESGICNDKELQFLKLCSNMLNFSEHDSAAFIEKYGHNYIFIECLKTLNKSEKEYLSMIMNEMIDCDRDNETMMNQNELLCLQGIEMGLGISEPKALKIPLLSLKSSILQDIIPKGSYLRDVLDM